MLGGLHAQQRGDDAHEDGCQGQGGELPAQQCGKESLPKGEGCPLSSSASSAPNYGGGDGGRLGDSTPRSENMAPMKTGAKDGAENSLSNIAAKNLSLRGGKATR